MTKAIITVVDGDYVITQEGAGIATGAAIRAEAAAVAAEQSEQNAAASASDAADSATAAAQSESNAASSASDAEGYLTALMENLPDFSWDVNTLAPGSDATLVGTGVYPNITLTFGVPRGDKGDKGDTGDKGDKGDTGDKGDKGDQGDPPPNPNFTTTTTTGAAGTNASVVLSGVYPDQTLAFTIPRGADGEGAGSVTSVDITPPTGMAASGGPITDAGIITLTYASGYQSYTSAEATKLSNIAIEATKNQTDAYLLNRANHTGAQAISTITGLQVALDGKAGTAVATTSANGLMASGDKSKLDGIAAGATANTGTVTSVGIAVPTGFATSGSPVSTSGTLTISYSSGYQGYTTAEASKLAGIAAGATANTGTVTSVAFSGGTTGLTAGGGPITGSGTFTLAGTLTVANGGTGAATAASARNNLGAFASAGGSITGPVTVSSASNVAAGTTPYTPTPTARNFFKYTNTNAFTIQADALTTCYTLVMEITNASGAGAMTATGFTYADTDAFNTTVGAQFIVQITSFGSGSKYLHVMKASA